MKNNFDILSDFTKYKKIFLEENSKHNLISKNDEKFLFEKHIYDSLALKIFLSKYNLNSGSILDIGCGGGFPCVPLAIELKEFNVTGIDSIRKKVQSVKFIKEELCIDNLSLVCDRVENLNKKFDIVVSRAVGNLEKICSYAFPLVKNGGYFVAYKSQKVIKEIEQAEKIIKKYGAKVVDIIDYNLPTDEIFERNLVVIKL